LKTNYLVFFVLSLAIFFFTPAVSFAQENNSSDLTVSYLKATVSSVSSAPAPTDQTESSSSSSSGQQQFNDWQNVKAKITEGSNINQEVSFTNQSSVLNKNDRLLSAGDKIIISYQVVNNVPKVSLMDFDRTVPLYTLVVCCLILLIIIGSFMGVRALLSFSWIGVILVGFFLHSILGGANAYLYTIMSALLIIFGTSFILLGWHRKTLLVILSSLFGVLMAALLMTIFGWWSHFSPIGQEETILFTMSPVLSKLNLLSFIYSSIVIGAIGSMMDMTISIVAGIEELITTSQIKGVRRLDSQELFRAGLNIGRNVMAAETNTMILAYFGSTLLIWSVALSQNYHWSILLSFSMVFGELLRILAGAMGIFSSIPMTAFLASRLLIYQRKFTNNSSVNTNPMS
jgi:uncharacterized membrane protein